MNDAEAANEKDEELHDYEELKDNEHAISSLSNGNSIFRYQVIILNYIAFQFEAHCGAK